MSKTRTKQGKKGKPYRIELTPLSAVLWAVFIFFSLVWIFVLGILVGRGFLPGTVTKMSDLKAQINRLQEMVKDDKAARTYGTQNEQDTALKLDFFQDLIAKKDEVKKSWTGDTQEQSPDRRSSPETGTVETPPAPEEVEKGTGPEKGDRAPVVSGDQYTVQVASLGGVEKAEKMVQHLTGMGYDAYYHRALVKGKTYYRIRCGRFRAREDALNLAVKIEKEAGLKGFVSRIE